MKGDIVDRVHRAVLKKRAANVSKIKCSICRGPLSANPPYPWSPTVNGKRYRICSPLCAFELGAKHGKRR